MTLEGAIIKEQGVTFAIVIVKSFVLQTNSKANETIESFSHYFPNIPVILMAQDYKGRPTYYGRKDIVNFLKNIPLSCIPWKKFTF